MVKRYKAFKFIKNYEYCVCCDRRVGNRIKVKIKDKHKKHLEDIREEF